MGDRTPFFRSKRDPTTYHNQNSRLIGTAMQNKFGNMQGVVNNDGFATLGYLANRSDAQYKPATKSEFLKGYDLDNLLGTDGTALEEGDVIECVDGDLLVTYSIDRGFDIVETT